MTKNDLNENEYNSYYKFYIDKTVGLNLKDGLIKNGEKTVSFFKSIPEAKGNHRYAESKWTVKELIQHIIDTERIFSYRALCISRNDKTPLPGFDHNVYVANCGAQNRSLDELIEDFRSVRSATLSLFNSLNEQGLKMIGTASDSPISVRAIAFILMGHEMHHCEVLKERYL